jgi:hypothetical protein
MGQAIGQDRLQLTRQVPRQGITHLDRRRHLGSAVLEHLGQVLARVPAAAEEQRSTCGICCDQVPGGAEQRHAPAKDAAEGEEAVALAHPGSVTIRLLVVHLQGRPRPRQSS